LRTDRPYRLIARPGQHSEQRADRPLRQRLSTRHQRQLAATKQRTMVAAGKSRQGITASAAAGYPTVARQCLRPKVPAAGRQATARTRLWGPPARSTTLPEFRASTAGETKQTAAALGRAPPAAYFG
jgi:hypothetical protein